MACKKTAWQLTPGPSGTPWSEDLFRSKKETGPLLISAFYSGEPNLPPFVEPSQYDGPSISGPSQSSESHEDASTHEPEPGVAPMKSMEDPVGKSPLLFFSCSQLSLTPPSTISNLSCYSPLCNYN
ncbi:hypothetical protein O181_021027 [Austropuccinia psidii MF-1]|uniref:Uncharacterized protein n=1 Tax=Austropuccinia psidii MF-1 TaxID=1389203 RepID=A0A9Q3CCS5_9BASI|nr:hypothetical protein [Austropuccinia psidii MF-1]